MQKFNPKWSELECINFLQHKIIKLSIAYYELDYSFIEDYTYDEICFQLVRMHEACSEREHSRFWYVMNDFDGSTGADLASRLTQEDRELLLYEVNKEIKIRTKLTKSTGNQEVKPKVKKKGRLF